MRLPWQKSPELLRDLARSALSQRDWANAAKRWKQVLGTELGTVSSEPVAGVARARRNLGDIDEAEAVLLGARRRWPRDVRILAELAVLENYKKAPSGCRSPILLTEAPAVEIVVCVYNALNETSACLETLKANISNDALVTVVDDGSTSEVRDYLSSYVSQTPNGRLLVNETNQGYTKSANRGLRSSRADWVVLLNSDALVTRGWLEGMLSCALSDPCIRAVGPLSNAATFQSVTWVSELLPQGGMPSPEDLEVVAEQLRGRSSYAIPRVPMLNGFCLMLHKPTLDDVGYLDESRFPRGYGEETDLSLRLLLAGHKLAIADHVFVYHTRSASFGLSTRKELTEAAVETLTSLWPGYSYTYVSEVIREIPTLSLLDQANALAGER